MIDLPLNPQGDHYIGGQWQPSQSGETFVNLAPATGAPIASIAAGNKHDIEFAVEAAKKAFKGPWGKMSTKERVQLIHKLGDKILEHRDELARLESIDTGKPYSETFHGDILRVANNFHFYADLVQQDQGQQYKSEDQSIHKVLRQPLGVVGLITPWNLPMYLATWKLAPALAQGNCVVIKPAELTPLTAALLGPFAKEVGIPDGVVNVVQGFGAGAAGEALVDHPDVKAISFTGETTTGTAIMKKAAPHLKKVSFELGGKGASVIFADADLDEAAASAAKAAFRNQGQVCLAGSRLIVEKSVASEVLERLLGHVKAIRLGDPLDPETTMGSLISREHRAKVLEYVELARHDSSVEILCGGRIPEFNPDGAFLEPTILTGCQQDSRYIQEEIFGPVLTVQTFETYDEAMSMLNGTPYGLSCSIWSKNLEKAEKAAMEAEGNIALF
jgi:aminomuconate-semialdehyde/2-hydroxymuconate-6-semialdehyde dehydrogenase